MIMKYSPELIQDASRVGESMRMSIIIPTLNEAERIGPLVSYLKLHGKNQLHEILVIDGQSSDETISNALKAGASVHTCQTRSRAAQMNLGASLASGNLLYFVHADALPPASYISSICAALQEGQPMGCFQFRFDKVSPLLQVNAFFTRFNVLMCRGGDQTLFVTQSLFQETGGYNEAYVIMEEYEWMQRARSVAPFRVMPDSAIVSARKYKGVSYARVNLANLCIFILFFAGVSPDRLRELYTRLLGQKQPQHIPPIHLHHFL